MIKLINASKQNNEIKLKNSTASIVLFILSLLILGTAYFLVIKTGIESFTIIAIASALGVAGTFLLFYSISGFLLTTLKKNKKLYYKELNSFIINQLNSRINTTFISTSIITLLIFLTIGILSTGASLTSTFNDNYSTVIPFDASVMSFNYQGDLEDDIQKESNIIDVFKEYHGYKIYYADEDLGDILAESTIDSSKYSDDILGINIAIVKLSDYNKLLRMQALDTVELEDNECLIIANYSELVSIWDEFLSTNTKVRVAENEFVPKNQVHIENDVQTGHGAYNSGTIVINDKYVKENYRNSSLISGNYIDGDIIEIERILEKEVNTYNRLLENNYLDLNTKEGYISSSLLLKISLSYIGIYLGVVFLIACSTILSLIQLSEADDNIKRYDLLSKLGTSNRVISKSILASILISFLIPLLVALFHSIFGIWWASETVKMLGKIDILDSIIYTASIITVVYGGYLWLTYKVIKRVVSKSIRM